MNIAVVGTGYVGLVTGACFAEYGVNVVAVDKDADKIAALQKGRVYVAPHPFQMGIDRGRRIVLRDDPPESGLRPSVSYLFRSVAAVVPRRTAAVLPHARQKDGAAELLELRSRGAVTIAQDEETSIVPGPASRA